jgi:2-C-methyl-D-erythritol 4-phosphate cytidylyltransferase/2-C-methyl-D-erythritol 2,4-cyclodiphosphate synthase
VAIHDAARPLVTEDIIISSIEAARETGAAIAAMPVVDTIKSSLDCRYVSGTPDRSQLYTVQTPQTFERRLIETAYERAYADSYVGTDDASLVERLGEPVAIVSGSYENIKVTTPTDVATAEAVLASRGENPGPAMRIGHGYDIHRFAPGRWLFLGGIEFPGEDGLLGHSDADVLLHALMDALLGAAGEPDIGRLFPDSDPSYKDIRSTELLARVRARISELGWRIGNVDITLIAERPRIARRVNEMQAAIAESLGVSSSQVGLKASTAEGLGPIGDGLGIECHAVALLRRT